MLIIPARYKTHSMAKRMTQTDSAKHIFPWLPILFVPFLHHRFLECPSCIQYSLIDICCLVEPKRMSKV